MLCGARLVAARVARHSRPAALRTITQQRWASEWVPASQFGTLTVRSGVDTTVRALDGSPSCPVPDDVEGLTSLIHISTGGAACSDTLAGIAVQTTDDGDVTVDASGLGVGSTLEIWAPFSMGIAASTLGDEPADTVVGVRSMEGPVTVETAAGHIELTKLKGGSAEARSTSGNITATSVQGNVEFESESGSVSIGKIQALVLRVTTGTGNIAARALYSNTTEVSSQAGAITLGSIHGDTNVVSGSGDVFVGSTEGSLTVRTESGGVEAHMANATAVELVSETGDVRTTTTGEGPLRITVVPEADTAIEVDKAAVSYRASTTESQTRVDFNIAAGGDDEESDAAHVAICTTGKVAVGIKSWFEASTVLTARLAGVLQ
mmetsp:Transcript_35072/g.91753  ORF Transcript_35072/g.91753 Transcript_35072/m.91753 type:complete len:377 (-) Transcript_35072:1438-2568(-)